MFPRPRLVLWAATLAAAAALVPAAASAAVQQVEQINRGNGAAGAFGLVQGPVTQKFGPVSNDGRFAAFGVANDEGEPNADFAYANPGDGLWLRDLVANTTTKIGSSAGFFTALDRTEHLYSFVTKQAIDRDDKNTLPDLYVYERTTGLKLLISRANGYRGAALGLTGVGSLTRNATTAVFTTASGVFRRNVLTGQNTRISGGAFVNSFDYFGEPDYRLRANTLAEDFASADGRVVATTEGIFAPNHITPAPLNAYDEALPTLVSEDGKTAVYLANGSAPDGVRRIDTATGAVTSVPVPPALTGRLVFLLRLTADGTTGLFITFKSENGGQVQEPVRWNLVTGATSVLPLPQGPWSRNEKFAVTGVGTGRGPIVVVPAAGGKLPGTVDAPSPNAYVAFTDVCAQGTRSTTIQPDPPSVLPAPASYRYRLRSATGATTFDRTIPYTAPGPDGLDAPVVLPVGSAPLKLEITIKLVDGRTITEKTARPAC